MYYVKPTIKNIERIPQPENRGKYIRLDQNENPDGIPEWLYEKVVSKMTPEYLSIYPEEDIFTEKFADFLKIKKENVTMCDGSVVGMGYIFKVFGEKGKNLICVTPTFGMYKAYAEMEEMNTIQVSYESDYTFKIENILNKIDSNTGIVVLVNPNMPMGNVYSQDEIIKVVEKAQKNNAIVIIDEAYYYFYDKTSLELINKYDNVILLRTFSKILSIPSLRMGAIISNPALIKYINNYKPHYTVNSIALLFGEEIINNFDRLYKELHEKFEEGKNYLVSELEKNSYEYINSYGCFLCIKPKKYSSEEITQKLKEKNILILCGKGDLTGFLRVTIWGKKYMEIFMNALLEIENEN